MKTELRSSTLYWNDIELEVDYEFTPADPRIDYYDDFSGYCGYPAEIDIISIKHKDFDFTEILIEAVFEDMKEQILEKE
jgi:hypothetical protein